MLIDVVQPTGTQQQQIADVPQVVLTQPKAQAFKDTFVGQVLLSVTIAVVTSYVTAVLIKRRGGW